MIDEDGSESYERETGDCDLACSGSESFGRETGDCDLACCWLNKPDGSSTSVTF